jgi:transcriptional regulator GlxA family with amidase domain
MHNVGFVLYPGFSPISFAITSVFELANWKVGGGAYAVSLVSERGGLVRTSLGYEIQTAALKRQRFNTVMIAGEVQIPSATPGLVRYLKSLDMRSTRVASTCTGAFVLAQAGLLDGRPATTHWYYARALQEAYPKVKVDADRIFTRDGRVWTSAGMSAGIDLALAMVEEDLGVDIARIVAKLLVVYHRRAGGQSQFSALLDLAGDSDRVQAALDYARKNLSKRLSVDDLADAVFLSARQFSRLFQDETGHSPAKAIERLRVESARLMMEEGRFSADEIARKNGFGSRDRMRRSFIRAFGQPPQVIQRTVRSVASSMR